MPTHAEQRVVPFAPEQLFDLIADIQRYPEFLPWCVGARIRKRDGNRIVADLVIGYKLIRERFTSTVTLSPEQNRIDVEYTDGPFKYLNNHWVSKMLQKIIEVFFNEAVRRMVGAFEARAHELYGPK